MGPLFFAFFSSQNLALKPWLLGQPWTSVTVFPTQEDLLGLCLLLAALCLASELSGQIPQGEK